MRRGAGVAAVLAASLVPASAARAQPAGDGAAPTPPESPARATAPAPIPRRTEPAREVDAFAWRYPTFRTEEYVATGVFAGLAVVGQLLPTPEPRWSAGNDLDGSVREALRLSSRSDRKTADDASDLTLTLLLNHAGFDAVGVAWWGRGKGSVAYQMLAIDAEAIALTAAVAAVSKGVAARARPFSVDCDGEADEADLCGDEDRHRSFISGHASTAFATASLTCMHHAYLDLYGHPAADAAACASAYGVAGATSVLRVVSDNHHTTDVVAGAAVGTLIGLGVPWLLHYRHPLDETASSPTDELSIRVIPGPTSATVLGTF